MDNPVTYVEAKSILSRLRGEDSLFGLTYSMNLYRGCQHGCIYCDTRSDCYGIGDISRISVKKNALELLQKELRPKKRKGTIGTGSMNDPYMPVEATEKLVEGALRIIADFRFPVHVITKSALVARDVDILQDISKTYAAVSFTVTTADDALARKLEPGASLPSARLRAMRQLADAGIYTGVTMMPMMPFITDTSQNIATIVKMAADAGARYILPMFGTTMRAGSRDHFYRVLPELFPGVKEKYESTFGNQYVCDSPDSRRLYDLFRNEMAKAGLKSQMDFYEEPADGQLSIF